MTIPDLISTCLNKTPTDTELDIAIFRLTDHEPSSLEFLNTIILATIQDERSSREALVSDEEFERKKQEYLSKALNPPSKKILNPEYSLAEMDGGDINGIEQFESIYDLETMFFPNDLVYLRKVFVRVIRLLGKTNEGQVRSKIIFKGEANHLGYILSTLEDHGYIDAPLHKSGDVNYTQFANLIMEHFSCIGLDKKEISTQTLAHRLNPESEYYMSQEKQSLFKIPHLKSVIGKL